MSHQLIRDIETIIRQGTTVDRAIATTRQRVIERHRQTQTPLVIWRDGSVVEVSPETVTHPAATHPAPRRAR